MGALDNGNGDGTIGHKIGGCLWGLMCVVVFILINTALAWGLTGWARWIVMDPDAVVAPAVYGIAGTGLLIYQGITVAWIVYGVNRVIKPKPKEGG